MLLDGVSLSLTMFSLVDPVFCQAHRGDISMLVAHVAGLLQPSCEREIILVQFGQHIFRHHEIRVVILDMLYPGDLSDRADRRAAYLTSSFGDWAIASVIAKICAACSSRRM